MGDEERDSLTVGPERSRKEGGRLRSDVHRKEDGPFDGVRETDQSGTIRKSTVTFGVKSPPSVDRRASSRSN